MSQSAIDQSTNNESPGAIVSADDVAQMANDLFTAMLALPFDPTPRDSFDPTATAIQSSIQIQGDWNAELRVTAPHELASEIACNMFGLEGEEISKSDIFDAMGEIVNVIGGNAKGVVDRDCKLSLPCVDDFRELLETPTLTTTFECMNHPITIQLHEKN
ncbi:MAG: chemotaxis protein CheX [Mariniblastus sp.]